MSFQLFKKIIYKFYYNDRFKIYFLISLSLIAGLMEYMGLALIFQFVLFLTNPDTEYSRQIVLFFNSINIDDFTKISLILGITIASIYIAKNVFMLFFIKYNNWILQDLSLNITNKVLKNFLFAPYLMAHEIISSDKFNIVSKISLVVWQFCLKYVYLIINSIISLILIAFLFIKFTKLALVATIFIGILGYVEYLYLKKKSDFQDKNYSFVFDKINKTVLLLINSIKEIKINNKETYFLNILDDEYKKFAKLNRDRSFNDVFHTYFTEISVMMAFIVILIFLFYVLKLDVQILLSSMCAICVVILRLTPSINRAQSAMYAINSNKRIAEELIEFDDKFDKYLNLSTTKEILPFNSTIELKNICFRYSSGNIGLENLNLKINKNEFIGIVGKSGSYKTTLTQIISGLIQVQNGEVLIDNIKLDDNNIKQWQNNISLLSQNYAFLFEDIYKQYSMKDDLFKKYLKELELNKKEIDLNKLSAGEKQRIALVDILMQDKNILILDEITSNLDNITQMLICNLLSGLKGTKTIISISHRLETLKNCDKIVFINNAKVIIDTFENIKNNQDFNKMLKISKI